jgi:hypothetical protein
MATDTMAARPQDRSYLAEIGDFLFATDTIAKIAKGKGTWGDAALVGVTAASFFIPPAKLAMLSSKALTTVIKASSKVAASETASIAAKRAAAKTLDDALTMKRQGYIPTGKEPVERVGRTGLGEPTPAYQVTERTVPTPAAKAERGMVEKKYSRTSDEDYNYYDRDIDPDQAAIDAVSSSRTAYRDKTTEKYVSNPKKTFEQKSRADMEQASKSEMYDKTKFTQDEIDDRIARLTDQEKYLLKRKPGESAKSHKQRLEDYVRGGDIEDLTPVPYATIAMRKTGEYTDDEIKASVAALRTFNKTKIELDAKEVTYLYLAIRKLLKDEKLKKGTVPADILKYFKTHFPELKKEFREKVVDTAEGKAILRKVEKEMPANAKSKDVLLRYEESLADDAKPGELKAIVDETINESPITPTIKGVTRTGKAPVQIKTKVPQDLLKDVSPEVERVASLLAERSKLNAFNATNATKLKTEINQKEISKLKQSSARNKKIIDRINDELREMRMLSREDKVKAQEIADEIKKRNLAARSEKYNPEGKEYVEGVAPVRVKPAVPGKGGETTKLTRQGKIAKARAEVERLRKQWSDTPAADTEARSRIAREAKKFADYIEKLEGK